MQVATPDATMLLMCSLGQVSYNHEQNSHVTIVFINTMQLINIIAYTSIVGNTERSCGQWVHSGGSRESKLLMASPQHGCGESS